MRCWTCTKQIIVVQMDVRFHKLDSWDQKFYFFGKIPQRGVVSNDALWVLGEEGGMVLGTWAQQLLPRPPWVVEFPHCHQMIS